MIIYEVNISYESSIADAYLAWLSGHIQEILSFAGFRQAEVGQINNSAAKHHELRVSYHIDSEDHLNDYLSNHAQKMRAEAQEKFGHQLSITRRIVGDVKIITKKG